MEDVIDMENELTSRLSTLQKKLDKNALNEVSKDVTKVQELIKANLQRSKVIQVKFEISPSTREASIYIRGHKFWINQDLDPLSTSKWLSEPRFCER